MTININTISKGWKQVDKVDGIEYCRTHDDFAVEGTDYSEVCHAAWRDDFEEGTCELVPLFAEVKPTYTTEGVTR